MHRPLDSIAGLRVQIRGSWTVIAGLVVWFLASVFFPQAYPEWPVWLQWAIATVAALMLTGAVVVHELAHTVVSRGRRVVVKGAPDFVVGGGDARRSRPEQPADELLPALAGPAASLVLAAALWLLGLAAQYLWPPLGVALTYTAVVSLLLGLLNLLPIFPLDGGWILRAVVWRASGDRRRATEIAVNTARLTGYVAVLGGALLLVQGSTVAGAWIIAGGLLAASGASAERERQQELAGEAQVVESPRAAGTFARLTLWASGALHSLRGGPAGKP